MTENHTKQHQSPHFEIKYPAMILFTSFVIMLIFDQLTWERQLGLQFLLMTLLVLVGLSLLIFIEKKPVPWMSYLLLVPIILSAAMTIFRKEAGTSFFNVILSLFSLALLAITLLNGAWMRYRIRDWLMGILRLIQSALMDPIQMMVKQRRSSSESSLETKGSTKDKLMPYLRGVLIALPLLLLLGGLLASADMIFKDRLSNLFHGLNFENFGELIWRGTYILILGYLLGGAYIHALTRSTTYNALTPDKPFIKPFLGHVEAFTVLGLVNLLFLGFIIIQFRYFFAGETNISLQGFTYAEYARRGFFELVAVAVISLGLYYTLSMVTKRAQPIAKRFFSVLGLLLMLQVGILLISAFQRLSLYEAAYGFTTLRTITHIFMIWLGVLLAVVVLMEVFDQFRRLAFILILIFFGFTLTLNLLNVDRFIAQRNIEHAIAGNPLDVRYLVWNLSDDGVPVLFDAYSSEETSNETKEALFATLACRYAVRKNNKEDKTWVEWHFSKSRSDVLFEQNSAELEAYPFNKRIESFSYLENGFENTDTISNYFIIVNGEEVWCWSENN